MNTTSIFLLSIFLCASIQCSAGVNYTLTFSGSGASTTVDNVVVQNLTQGTTVTVPAGSILNLSDGVSALDQVNTDNENICIYPNNIAGSSILSFTAKQTGSVEINIYNLDGRKETSISQNLQVGRNLFQLSLKVGYYVVQIVGSGYSYNAKMIIQSDSQNKSGITYIDSQKTKFSNAQKQNSPSGVTTMTYATGDLLLFNGNSGNYSTIITDTPISDKNINFDFTGCSDADGNNYKIVKIGTQTWMAENLKTTKLNDGTEIPNITDGKSWVNLTTPAYCWYNNNANTYKNVYGALYSWQTVNTTKLCPKGWHVPTDAEWTILENYLIANGFNFDSTTIDNKFAKSLAATSNWTATWPNSPTTGDIAYGKYKNNRTGFFALPGGSLDSSFGGFGYLGGSGYWWSSTEGSTTGAWARGMYCASKSVNRDVYYKSDGFSVRCIKD